MAVSSLRLAQIHQLIAKKACLGRCLQVKFRKIDANHISKFLDKHGMFKRMGMSALSNWRVQNIFIHRCQIEVNGGIETNNHCPNSQHYHWHKVISNPVELLKWQIYLKRKSNGEDQRVSCKLIMFQSKHKG